MKRLIIFSLSVFILSCATAPQTEILDDRFISSRPYFQVQFHKPIVKRSEESQRIQRWNIKTYMFLVNNTEGVVIEIATFTPDRSGYFFYGPEQVLTDMGRIVLDSVGIDGRQWIKFVDVLENNFLVTGYFRLSVTDESFINVFRVCSSGSYPEEIEFIKSGTPVNDRLRKSLNEEFIRADQLFSIGKK
jgi:hypothetical protein